MIFYFIFKFDKITLICTDLLWNSKADFVPNLLCWKYKINEFYFGTNKIHERIHELVIFNQTTKIDTHEEKYFHSS